MTSQNDTREVAERIPDAIAKAAQEVQAIFRTDPRLDPLSMATATGLTVERELIAALITKYLHHAIAQALRDERAAQKERDAKIAEEWANDASGLITDRERAYADGIATAIRSDDTGGE